MTWVEHRMNQHLARNVELASRDRQRAAVLKSLPTLLRQTVRSKMQARMEPIPSRIVPVPHLLMQEGRKEEEIPDQIQIPCQTMPPSNHCLNPRLRHTTSQWNHLRVRHQAVLYPSKAAACSNHRNKNKRVLPWCFHQPCYHPLPLHQCP